MSKETAIITGAASGMGRASAILFAEKGYNVVAVDFNAIDGEKVVAEINAKGGNAIFVKADVSKKDECEKYVQAAVDKFGTVDVFFNNAGVMQSMCMLADTPEDQLDKVIAVNFKGAFFGLQAVLKVMEKQGHGRIINNASTSSVRAEHSFGAYSASKHAMLGLTKSVALEYTSKGILCNAICPGGIETNIVKQVTENMKETGYMPAEFSNMRIGRYGRPEEIAYVVVALADKANSFMSGSIIAIDGATLM